MFKFIIFCIACTSVSYGANCFTRTFCSEGKAPKYISCPKGKDCLKERDRGLQFRANCTVEWHHGDLNEIKSYTFNDGLVTIEGPQKTKPGKHFKLSPDAERLNSLDSPQDIYSEKACKGYGP